MVRARMKVGNGYILSEVNDDFLGVFETSNGTFSLNWNLGCDVENQEVVLYLYHYKYCENYHVEADLCAPLDSISFHAKTIFPKGWVKTCGLSQYDLQNTSPTSVNDKCYVVNFKTLYIPNFTLITSWKPYSESLRSLVNEFAISPSQKLYVGSEGGMYSFADSQLKFLTEKTEGSGVIAVLAEDSVLFCSFAAGKGLYRIRPKELEWTFLSIEGAVNRDLTTILRHPNGDLYSLEDNQYFWISHDNGDSWTHFQKFNKYIGFQPLSFAIDPNGLLYLATKDGILRVISPVDFSIIEEHSHNTPVYNICFREGIVYYWADGKIYSSANNWQPLELRFDKPIHGFALDHENKFYIKSKDGIYVFRE